MFAIYCKSALEREAVALAIELIIRDVDHTVKK